MDYSNNFLLDDLLSNAYLAATQLTMHFQSANNPPTLYGMECM